MRLAVILAAFALWIAAPDTRLVAQTAQRPNIVLIISDDHRWDGLGAAGNPHAITPNLDRLAKDGVYFRQAVAHIPQCSPNRATILTGRSPHQTGWYSNQSQRKDVLGPNGLGANTFLPKLLQDSGYHTALVGKWHLQQQPWLTGFGDVRTWIPGGGGPYFELPVARGNARMLAPAAGAFTQDLFGEDAVAYVKASSSRKQPFFLWVALTAPHVPSAPNPDRIRRQYEGKTDDALLPPAFDRSAKVANWRTYYEAITSADEQVGRIMQALADNNLTRNTIVLFMGDNGLMMHSRGWSGKVIPYEESVRVPFVIHAPALATFKGPTDAAASSLDLPTSIARWAGITVPGEWAGRDLTTALRSRTDHKLPHAIVEFPDTTSEQFGRYAYRSIRTPAAKLILWEDKTKRDELYDLTRDPRETSNSSTTRSTIARKQTCEGISKRG